MRFFSSRYCVAIEYGVATAGLVAMIFNIELVVAIFCSLRCHVNIEFRVATIRFVAKFFFFNIELMVAIFLFVAIVLFIAMFCPNRT